MVETLDDLIGKLQEARKIHGGDAPFLHEIYCAGDIRESLAMYLDAGTEDDRKCQEMADGTPDRELLEMFENEYFQPEADDYYESIGGVAEQLQKRIDEEANQDEQR